MFELNSCDFARSRFKLEPYFYTNFTRVLRHIQENLPAEYNGFLYLE